MVHLTRQQVREVDRLAIEQLGIPGIVLMENAGRNAAAVVLDTLQSRGGDSALWRVGILCGGGNNGGDGYAIARHLHNHGVQVAVYAAVDPTTLTGDAGVNHRVCAKMGLTIRLITTQRQLSAAAGSLESAHVVVDALLGTGFSGEVRPHMAGVIAGCNELAGPTIVSIDTPSGLDCDTGQPSNATVRADITLTLVAAKQGFVEPAARAYLGRVIVADIGTPPSLIDRVIADSVDGSVGSVENG